jgi:hypothetical protein
MNGWKGVTSGVIYRKALELLAIARHRLLWIIVICIFKISVTHSHI